MIDFNTQQLSWIVIGAISMGGTSYLTVNNKIDDLDKKMAVTINNTEHVVKSIDEFKVQLTRVEDKLENKSIRVAKK
jgi:hypothetical protein